jgi:hypothetical protein
VQHRHEALGDHHAHDLAQEIRRLSTHDLQTLRKLGGQRAFPGARRAADHDQDWSLPAEMVDHDQIAPRRIRADDKSQITVRQETEVACFDLVPPLSQQIPEDRRGHHGRLFVGKSARL